MMSQRFTLFYAGFTAYCPALYFNQLEFIDAYQADENESVISSISRITKELQDKVYESNSHLKTAISVANHMEIEILPEPLNHEDYFNWLHNYIDCFEKEFPMGRIDHYYFLFARKISEILCNMGLLKVYIETNISANGSLDLSRRMEKCLKDTEFILFKLMAAAALLSSEPRQNYFNVFYKSLCLEFEPFKGIDVNGLSVEDLEKLLIKISEYDLSVTNGFKKCIGLLKEIGA